MIDDRRSMVDCRPLDDDEKSSVVEDDRASNVIVDRRSIMDDRPIDGVDGLWIVDDR